MPLLTKENLTAPLTNKTNLLTILCITVAFATFRLSGGSLIGDDRPQPDAQESVRPTLGSTGGLGEKQDYSSDRNVLKEILAEKSEEEDEKTDRGTPGGLEEIERAIGLR